MNSDAIDESKFRFDISTIGKDKNETMLYLRGTVDPMKGVFTGTWGTQVDEVKGSLELTSKCYQPAKVKLLKQDSQTSDNTFKMKFDYLPSFEEHFPCQ